MTQIHLAIKIHLYRYKDIISDIGKIEISALKLSLEPINERGQFFVGDWAKVTINSTNNDFYDDYR